MAIKVGGTTVVDDSRGLTNIATVDATTAAAISAAGVGGGGEHDFVASGAIETGDVVTLNSDGTVSAVSPSGSASSLGSETVFSNATTTDISATFDSNSNKIVVVYRVSGTSTAVVGTVSGTTISFGSSVVFDSNSLSYSSIVFDSSANKIVVAYRDTNNNYGTAIVGTVSGTSISFGTKVVFESATTADISATYDVNSNKVVIAYTDLANSYYGTAIVGTVSGTSISFGSPTVFNAGQTLRCEASYDSYSNKVIIAYRDNGNSSYGTAIIGTVSGTSISFGSEVVFESSLISSISSTFDSKNNKVVICYNASSLGKAIVGEVSGTSISFGSANTFRSASAEEISVTFDSSSNKVVISYDYNYDGFIVSGIVSGTSITFDTVETYTLGRSQETSTTFDSNSNRVVTFFKAQNNSDYGTSVVYRPSSSNASSYIGVAAEDISDTATGAVTIDGGVNTVALDNYDLANASYDGVSYVLASGTGAPVEVFFRPDGSNFYVSDESRVRQYEVSSAWVLSSASSVSANSFYTGTSTTGYNQGIYIKPDGTKFYLLTNSDIVYEYSLSTPWLISSASAVTNFNFSSQGVEPSGLTFKPDGTKMYVTGWIGANGTGGIYEYGLSTPWDVSTASYIRYEDLVSLVGSVYAERPSFDRTGTSLFIQNRVSSNRGYKINLTTAWDITSNSTAQSFSFSNEGTTVASFAFKDDGLKMYSVNMLNDTVFQYTTGTFGGYTINASQFVADNGSLTTTNNGRKIGRGISSSELLIDSAMTGDETNEYLGSLV